MSDDVKEYFAFEHQTYEGKIYYTKVSGDECWPDVLEDFVRFLESIYKYNIKDHIRLEKPAWADLDTENEIYDPWQNHYFEIYKDVEVVEDSEDADSSNS